MNKIQLRDRVLSQLRSTLALQVGAAQLARDEAISEESRPENQYDTHSLEAGYLAEGQARQAAEIEESIAAISAMPLPAFDAATPLALGAIAEVGVGGAAAEWYFLCPRAGGLEVRFDDRDFLVVTPQSPLGRALLGHREGEGVQLPGRRTRAESRILSVR